MPQQSGDLNRWARQAVATDGYFGLDSVHLAPGAVSPAAPCAVSTPPETHVAIEQSIVLSGDARPTRQAEILVEEKPQTRAAIVATDERSHPDPGRAEPVRIPMLRDGVDLGTVLDGPARADALARLSERHDRECPHCTTSTYHTRTVFGEGNCEAQLMFIGEAPGETEDQLGRPFVGKAGQKLDEMIRAMGFARADVYIANVLKSRPPENRTPLQQEVERCGPYLIEQILIIRPAVIVTLGGPATKLILATELGITRLRGIWATFDVPLVRRGGLPQAGSGHASGEPGGDVHGPSLTIPVMPTFHPAYLLRNYTPETRRQVWSDLQAVLGKLREARTGAMPTTMAESVE